MSGGSYDYLYCKELGDLSEDTLQQMADRLAALGYASDAAQETTEILLMLRQYKIRIETRMRRMERVWKAVEWWDSGDWGEDSVREALKGYRGESI